MHRALVLALLCAGCSTAPIADLLDHVKPGKLEPPRVAPYGGVCNPQPGPPTVVTPGPPAGALVPGAQGPPILGGPVTPAPAPAPGALPPPSGLPPME